MTSRGTPREFLSSPCIPRNDPNSSNDPTPTNDSPSCLDTESEHERENRATPAMISHLEGLSSSVNDQIAHLQKEIDDLRQSSGQTLDDPDNTDGSKPRLPVFKVTSCPPPSFNGNFGTKPAHVVNATIEEYLDNAQQQCLLHGFLADNERPRYIEHKTYVQWLCSGLKGSAATKWRSVDIKTRQNMHWRDYCKWIRKNFTSQLAVSQAIDALDIIQQRTSVIEYNTRFNELVDSLIKNRVSYPEIALCTKYRRGLKTHLSSHKDIYESNDLQEIQDRAETLDDIHTRTTRAAKRSEPKSSSSGTANNNIQAVADAKPKHKPLTAEEKALYKENCWCTYCRSHDHTYEDCTAPGKRQHKKSTKTDNAVATVGSSRATGSQT
ncbi:hypothetical protein HDU97_009514 [Phlyctochytrium planicorne]|nr:hypothetical protein HDU97_009514 [Phlyctochytrium planicorne]